MARISIALESLNRPLRQAAELVATFGVRGVSFDAGGELAPERLSQTARKDLRRLFRALNLELAAIGCPLRHGFDRADRLEQRIERVRQTLNLAYDLGPRLVLVDPGLILERPEDPSYPLIRDSLLSLGRHGDRVGSRLALEAPGPAPAELARFLASFDTGGLGAHLDPAHEIVQGRDPAAAARALAAWIAHVAGRDARGGARAGEVALGHGDVDWQAFLGSLEEIGYQGWITLRRGPCSDPVGDLRQGALLLGRLTGQGR